MAASAPARLAEPPLHTALHTPAEPLGCAAPLSSAPAQRWVWHSRYGTIVIEVVGNTVFVDGQRVEPHVA
jgi:hypothetical protein